MEGLRFLTRQEKHKERTDSQRTIEGDNDSLRINVSKIPLWEDWPHLSCYARRPSEPYRRASECGLWEAGSYRRAWSEIIRSKVCPECCELGILLRKEAVCTWRRTCDDEGRGRGKKWLAAGCWGVADWGSPYGMLCSKSWSTRGRYEHFRWDAAEGSWSQFREALTESWPGLPPCSLIPIPQMREQHPLRFTLTAMMFCPSTRGRKTME